MEQTYEEYCKTLPGALRLDGMVNEAGNPEITANGIQANFNKLFNAVKKLAATYPGDIDTLFD